MTSSTCPKKTGDERKVTWLIVCIASLGAMAVLTVVTLCFGPFFVGIKLGPSFIEQLRTGAISESDISSVAILKFDPGGGWPFFERDYARKAHCQLKQPEHIRQLLVILRDYSRDGRESRNHPASHYYGIFRFDDTSGGHYYVIYNLGSYDRQFYVSLGANARNGTNPNAATGYENVPLAEFLKEHDPWYFDSSLSRSMHRPNCPDDVP